MVAEPVTPRGSGPAVQPGECCRKPPATVAQPPGVIYSEAANKITDRAVACTAVGDMRCPRFKSAGERLRHLVTDVHRRQCTSRREPIGLGKTG
ncbi:MAG: hypothetical protein ABI641_13270 [Caldimonas sp.]